MIRFVSVLVLAAAAVSSLGQTKNPASTNTAAISGRVLDAVSASPIPGVRIVLTEVSDATTELPFVEPPAMSNAPPATNPKLTTITDASGRFTVGNLPAGVFEIDASKAGWVLSGTERNGQGTRWFVVEGGQRVANADVRLARAPTVRGRVVDETGEPVAGLTVIATAVDSSATAGRVFPVRTDDRGVFSRALPPGEYVIATAAVPSISTEGPISTAYPSVFFPQARTITGATRLRLNPGDTVDGIDFAVGPEPVFRVTVSMESESRVREITTSRRIELRSADGDGTTVVSRVEYQLLPRTVLHGVPAGNYIVGWMSGPVLPALERARITPLVELPATSTTWAERPVSVTNRDVELNLTFETGARISGRVEFDGAESAPTRDELTGSPLIIERADGVAADIRGVYFDGGRFSTIQMVPGRYLVRPRPLSGWRVQSVTLGGRDVCDTPIELGQSDVRDVVIRFTDRRSAIAGRLLRDRPEDATRGFIVVFPVDRAFWRDYGSFPRRIKVLSAGRSGDFDIEVPPGQYHVAAVRVAPGRAPTVADFEGLARTATSVIVSDGATSRLQLRFPEAR